MAPLLDMTAVQQAIADAMGMDLPRAMQSYAVPYGWPGFIGDIVGLFIALRINKGQSPLFLFQHYEIRHRRLATVLVTIQLLSCTAIAIYTLINCSNSDSSHPGVLLIGSARMFLAFHFGLALLNDINKSKTPDEHGNSTPSADTDGEAQATAPWLGQPEPATQTGEKGPDSKTSPDDHDSSSQSHPSPASTPVQQQKAPPPFSAAISDAWTRMKWIREPNKTDLETADAESLPPYSPEAPAAAHTSPTTDSGQLAKLKQPDDVVVILIYVFLSIPLSLISAGAYLLLDDLGAWERPRPKSMEATAAFATLTITLVMTFIGILFSSLGCDWLKTKTRGKPDVRKAIFGKDGSVPQCWGWMFSATIVVTWVSNWVLRLAAGSNMPEGGHPVVLALYWVYFVTSKCLLLSW